MTETDGGRVRPVADFLREQAKGATHEELSEGLRDLVARVMDTGKGGSISLKITVEPMKGSKGSALVVTDEIKLRLPEHDRQSSLFFSDREGNLVREDPNQLAFDTLREVNTETGEIREVPRAEVREVAK